MYCPTCGVASSDQAKFCGECSLNLELVRMAISGGNNVSAADAIAPYPLTADLPMLSLSVDGLQTVEALWSEVSCASPGKVNISRRDLDDDSEYMQFFLRGSCLRITCSKTKTHVARDLVKDKKIGEVFNRRKLELSILFNEIHGPTYLGYADTVADSSSEPLARLLTDSDREDFERFRAAIKWNEWLVGRLAWGQPVAAVYADGQIVSAAGYGVRDNRIAQICVVTRPEFRRRRFASGCVVRIAQYAIKARLIVEYQTEKENSASMALVRRLGFVPFAEKIFLTFKDTVPNDLPSKPAVKLSTSIEIINAIFEEEGLFKEEEALKQKYGNVAVADARRIFDEVRHIRWYGSNYAANRSQFESDLSGMFPGLSDKTIEKLHTSYASGWIP